MRGIPPVPGEPVGGVWFLIVATFNVNSIRTRLDIVHEWLTSEQPDILCLQEIKATAEAFPREPFDSLGYHLAVLGRKAHAGVAIASKSEISNIRAGLSPHGADEARLLAGSIDGITVINTYVPQGRAVGSEVFAYKLGWLEAFRSFLEDSFTPEAPLIWCGDFNVAPDDRDVYDPERLRGSLGFHPEEQRRLEEIRNWGLVDIYRQHVSEGQRFTFWDYRVPNAVTRNMGWRIDHIWATAPLAQRSVRAWIDLEPRLAPRPSDHTVVAAEFDWPSPS